MFVPQLRNQKIYIERLFSCVLNKMLYFLHVWSTWIKEMEHVHVNASLPTDKIFRICWNSHMQNSREKIKPMRSVLLARHSSYRLYWRIFRFLARSPWNISSQRVIYCGITRSERLITDILYRKFKLWQKTNTFVVFIYVMI